MGGFAEAVRERIREARARLKAALKSEDAFEVAMAEDELDDALRMAHKHGISTGDEASGK
ncbi:hypothetical protein ACWEQP_27325 [Streptomyces sp. NPDC004044]|uniref:hypothetical protein n=1 Tax=Streptomyces sp. NBC_01527 TaxID=2903894 RepID=UPI002F90E399